MSANNRTLVRDKRVLDILSRKINLPVNELRNVIDAYYEVILQEAWSGKDVQVGPLGRLVNYDREATSFRNPATGERFVKAPTRLVKINPSTAVKQFRAELDEDGNPIRDGEFHPVVERNNERNRRREEKRIQREQRNKTLAALRNVAKSGVNADDPEVARLLAAIAGEGSGEDKDGDNDKQYVA